MCLVSGEETLPVGTVVLLAAPEVDRARVDPTQIVAVVVSVSARGLHKVATKDGILAHGTIGLNPKPKCNQHLQIMV